MNILYSSLYPNQSNGPTKSTTPQSTVPSNGPKSVLDIMTEVKNSGMTAEQLFYKKASESGADVNDILRQARDLASGLF